MQMKNIAGNGLNHWILGIIGINFRVAIGCGAWGGAALRRRSGEERGGDLYRQPEGEDDQSTGDRPVGIDALAIPPTASTLHVCSPSADHPRSTVSSRERSREILFPRFLDIVSSRSCGFTVTVISWFPWYPKDVQIIRAALTKRRSWQRPSSGDGSRAGRMRTVLLVIVILTMSEPASAWISQIRHGRSRSRLTRQMKKNDENGVVETTTTTTTTMEDPSTILSTSTNWDSYNVTSFDNVDSGATLPPRSPAQQTYDLQGDIVTKFLRIVESQQQLGGNCTAGTDLNLGEGVVDKYAQVSTDDCLIPVN